MTSQFKTLFLMTLLGSLAGILGLALGGKLGLIIGVGFAVAMNFWAYWFSDKYVLKHYNARELSAEEAPMLHRMVEDLARNAGIPKPKICIMPDETPNAFATGRNPEHGVVAVTQGIVRLLSPDELRGVIAHELGHIANRDILIQSVAATIASAIVSIANMMQWAAIFGIGSNNDEEGGGNNFFVTLLMIFLAPIAASIIQFAISRSREYLADETGAKLCGNPNALASALNKITAYSKQIPMREATPSTAHMFIINPFAGGLQKLFSTHPPVEERVARLHAMQARTR